MRFEFFTPTRIIFGAGAFQEVPSLVAALGRRAIVVAGVRPEPVGELVMALAALGVQAMAFPVAGEPSVELVQEGLALARQHNCDLFLGYGGGSAIDTAKALAILLANGGDPLDYLEVIGRGKPLGLPPLPCIAIPTTAGTGAEVTRNAVLASPKHRVKVSLRSPFLAPRLAVLDPELTYDLPPAVTASTGLDALTQLIEPFVSIRANPLTGALCRDAIPRVALSLLRAYRDGSDRLARNDMVLASLFGGLALANAGLGTVHGFASVLGGMYPAPHGAICARLLPATVAANIQALRLRAPDSEALARYDEIARLLTGDQAATAADAVRWLADLAADLQIPGLGSYGLTPLEFDDVVAKTMVASSTKANPVALTPAELLDVLKASI